MAGMLTAMARLTGAAAALALAAALGGCGAMVADLPVVGLPEGAPARPADPGAFPAVHDVPDARNRLPADATARDRIEQDLTAARERQQRAVSE